MSAGIQVNRSQSYSANSDFGDHWACVFRFSNAFVTTVNIVMLVLMSLCEATFMTRHLKILRRRRHRERHQTIAFNDGAKQWLRTCALNFVHFFPLSTNLQHEMTNSQVLRKTRAHKGKSLIFFLSFNTIYPNSVPV